MTEPLYVICGASGRVGKLVASRLLEAKKRVRVVGRAPDRLKALTSAGAQAAIGSLDEPLFTHKAFENATAVFALVPPNDSVRDFRTYQDRVADALVAGVRENRVPFVVSLSSIGAHLSEGSGPVLGLRRMEQHFNTVPGLNVLHLRAAYFFENAFRAMPMMKVTHVHGGALRSDLLMPMIASRDVAEVAARRLAALDFSGQNVLELQGAKDLTMTELTQHLGKAVGDLSLRYQQFSYEEVERALMRLGMREQGARLLMEMSRAFNEGRLRPIQPRSALTTTPMSVAAFADAVFAPAYRAR